MNLEIKLPDPEYCNGCPLCWYDETDEAYCRHRLENIRIPNEPLLTKGALIIRPQICKDKNGE